jgi:hypothetical protein
LGDLRPAVISAAAVVSMKRIYTKALPHGRGEYREDHKGSMIVALLECNIKVRFVGAVAELVSADGGTMAAFPGQFIVLDDNKILVAVLSLDEYHARYNE